MDWFMTGVEAPGPAAILALSAVVALSAVFRGFTGFGFAIVAVPLLSLLVSPTRAVAVATGLQVLGGLVDLHRSARSCHWPSIRWLVAGVVLTAPIGALILSWVAPDVARLLVAAACAIAVAALALGVTFATMPGPAGTVAVGAVAGLFSGLAAMPGPPAITFYLASPLSPAQVRASLIVFFLFAALIAGVSLVATGAFGRAELLLSLVGLPVMIAGSAIGAALFRRLGGAHRRVSLAALSTIALLTAARGIAGLL
jgi:hypothetical protein